MAFKLTDWMDFYEPVKKFHVATGTEKMKRVFISIGPGGKGSEYVAIEAEDALRLARYLTVEAHRVIEARGSDKPKK